MPLTLIENSTAARGASHSFQGREVGMSWRILRQ